MTQFLKRREKGATKAKEAAAAGVETADPSFSKKYPALSEFLACEEWSPGEERVRGTVSVFFEDGGFKAAVNDRDGERSAFVSKGAFTGLLEAIEKGLQAGSLDWRDWKGNQGKGKKKG